MGLLDWLLTPPEPAYRVLIDGADVTDHLPMDGLYVEHRCDGEVTVDLTAVDPLPGLSIGQDCTVSVVRPERRDDYDVELRRTSYDGARTMYLFSAASANKTASR